MRSLNLDQLRTLITIGELGTFSAAAHALHLAPPTVSLHVSELEARLDVLLLERASRGVVPTAVGAALIERARRLLKDADDVVDHIRRHAEGRAGKVRLGTSTGVLAHLLPSVLDDLRHCHPGIEVDIEIVGSAQAVDRVASRALDIGIVSLPQVTSGLDVTKWRSDPMFAFVPAAWSVPARVDAKWLAERPFIGNDPTTHMYRLTAEWFGQAGLAPRARIELNHAEAIKSLVAAGYGAAVLPLERRGSKDVVLPGVKVQTLKPPLTRQLGLVHRKTSSLDAATKNVLASLRQAVKA